MENPLWSVKMKRRILSASSKVKINDLVDLALAWNAVMGIMGTLENKYGLVSDKLDRRFDALYRRRDRALKGLLDVQDPEDYNYRDFESVLSVFLDNVDRLLKKKGAAVKLFNDEWNFDLSRRR